MKINKRNIINFKFKQFKIYKFYKIDNIIDFFKKLNLVNFFETIDVSINLGKDLLKVNNSNIKGTTILPYKTRNICVIVFTSLNKNVEEAKKAGADYIGMYDLYNQIKYIKYDVVIASPEAINLLNKLGKILGVKMPNINLGTITNNIYEAVIKAKKGQIFFKSDKYGIIHTSIGKTNLLNYKLLKNFNNLILSVIKTKPIKYKGIYIKKITLSTTMNKGIKINLNDIKKIRDIIK